VQKQKLKERERDKARRACICRRDAASLIIVTSLDYNQFVHRVAAILLLSVFSLLPVASALGAGSGTQLPACCRTNGKHKCAMSDAPKNGHSAEATVSSIGSKCPYAGMQGFHPVPGSSFATSRAGAIFFGAVLSHPVLHAQTEARFRISFSRAQQKRGPPSLLF
jgi:hypothetical protein